MTQSDARGTFRDRIVDDYAGYKVYDRDGEKLGKIEYTVLDRQDQPEYLGIKTGLFGSKTTLIPEELLRLSDSGDFEVQATENQVKDAPTVSDEDDVSPDFEQRILQHYGLGSGGDSSSTSSTSSTSSASSASSGAMTDRHDDRENRSHEDQSHDDRSREGRFGERGETESRSRDDDRGGLSDRGDGFGDESGGSSEGYRDRDDSSRSSGAGSAIGGAAAGGAVGAAASRSGDRDSSDRRDTEYRDTGDTERGSRSEEEGEKIRVTLKREKARAERVIDEDGEEEVRIRKRTVREETLIDVEDPRNR